MKKNKEEKICKLKDVYRLLKARPFSNECIHEADLYEAYCLRIIETLENLYEEKYQFLLDILGNVIFVKK